MEGGVGTDSNVLRLSNHFVRFEGGSSGNYFVTARSENQFFHPMQLVPAVRVSSPDPLRPDLFIGAQIPYLLVFGLGIILGILYRRVGKMKRGFPMVNDA